MAAFKSDEYETLLLASDLSAAKRTLHNLYSVHKEQLDSFADQLTSLNLTLNMIKINFQTYTCIIKFP